MYHVIEITTGSNTVIAVRDEFPVRKNHRLLDSFKSKVNALKDATQRDSEIILIGNKEYYRDEALDLIDKLSTK